MPSQLNPYLNFNGNARDAMEFYASIFGGELRITTFAELGADGPDGDRVMHSVLHTTNGYTIMGADTPSTMEFQPMSGSSVSISGDEADADALRGYWQQLSAGGTTTMAMEKQAWGDEFGMCIDRFGVPWMIDVGSAAG
jgi:PhnB protein